MPPAALGTLLDIASHTELHVGAKVNEIQHGSANLSQLGREGPEEVVNTNFFRQLMRVEVEREGGARG